MKFYELAVGAVFFFRGQRFEKTAMSAARGEDGCGHMFFGVTDVEPDGDQPLLPPEEAARWRGPDEHWADYLAPAPGQGKRVKESG